MYIFFKKALIIAGLTRSVCVWNFTAMPGIPLAKEIYRPEFWTDLILPEVQYWYRHFDLSNNPLNFYKFLYILYILS